MEQQKKITYRLHINDFLTYQKRLFLSNKNPSAADSVSNWVNLSFLLIVVTYPWLVYLITRSLLVTAIMFILALIVFLLIKKNDRKVFWRFYQPKSEKDLLSLYFDNDPNHTISTEVTFSEDRLFFSNIDRSKTIFKQDIELVEISQGLLFFYTTKHDGSIIPLLRLSEKD